MLESPEILIVGYAKRKFQVGEIWYSCFLLSLKKFHLVVLLTEGQARLLQVKRDPPLDLCLYIRSHLNFSNIPASQAEKRSH